MTTLHRSSKKKLCPPLTVEGDFKTRASALEMMLGSEARWSTMMMVVLKTTNDHQAMASKHSEPLPRTLPLRTPALSTLAVRLYSSFDHRLPWGAGQVTSPLGREGYVIRLPEQGRNGKTVAPPKKPTESTLQDTEPEDTGAQRPSVSSWFGWRSHGCSQWRGEGSSTALESDKLWGFGYSMQLL